MKITGLNGVRISATLAMNNAIEKFVQEVANDSELSAVPIEKLATEIYVGIQEHVGYENLLKYLEELRRRHQS